MACKAVLLTTCTAATCCRYADFAGDQAVAPVRETAAQALGAALLALDVPCLQVGCKLVIAAAWF